MISLSPSTSRLLARTSISVMALSILVFGAWTAGGLFGQPPAQKKQRTEQEEDAPKKPKRKVIPVEDPEDPKAESKAAPKRPSRTTDSGNPSQWAEQESHPSLQNLFRSLAVPYDWAFYKRTDISLNGEKERKPEKIEPIPFYLGDDPVRHHEKSFQVTPLTEDGKPDTSHSVDPIRLERVRSYEEIAQEKVHQFLGEKHANLSPEKKLEAAERILKYVINWHESENLRGRRSGKEWDGVERSLRKQLLEEVLLKQMELLAQAKDWDGVQKLTRELAGAYGKDLKHQNIFKPIAKMIEGTLTSAASSPETKQKARERLHKLEMEFPDNPAFQPLSNMLRQEAGRLLTNAKAQHEANKDAAARALLEEAKKVWPQLEGLHEFENTLNNDRPVLRVGVRGSLPKYFSPALACTDNELRAVEMLFESLVKRVPDESGGFRYRRGLAEFSPKVVPLGRSFQLPRNARWSNGQPLDSSDIAFSLVLLQNGKGVGRSRIWRELLASAQADNDSSQVTMRMKQGFLDPLAAMSFKILPCNLPDNIHVYDEAFALNPVTSGPFLLGQQKTDEGRRECRFFEANPKYSVRPTKRHTPHIQEVRFYSYDSNTDIAEMLVKGQLDLVLDLTAKETQSLLSKANAGITVPLPSPAALNRRIYFLAINTSTLDDAMLRRALSCAIDREGLLNKHFRGSLKVPLHKALSGPFPAGSWAGERDNGAGQPKRSLFDPDGATTLSKTAKSAKAGPFTLKYTSDNPALDEAMKDLCDQVKERTGVVLLPTPCDPYQLREDVEQRMNYEIAYCHYDFPDESYWLAPLFGPPPGREDYNNIFKYNTKDLAPLLDATKNYRSFDMVRDHQRQIERILNREMPLVPLWQLDPLLAYRREVQPAALDPLLLFGNIDEWRMQHR